MKRNEAVCVARRRVVSWWYVLGAAGAQLCALRLHDGVALFCHLDGGLRRVCHIYFWRADDSRRVAYPTLTVVATKYKSSRVFRVFQ